MILPFQASAKADKSKGKKKAEPEMNLTHSTPEYNVLALFHVPLVNIAEGEFAYSDTIVCSEMPSPEKRAGSADSESESITKKVM